MDKRSPTAERHAELVLAALCEVAPAGMTLLRLAAACELSRWQTRRALAAVKDLCAERDWPPVIYTREAGHHVCASEDELEEWERAWLSEKLTRFRRVFAGVVGPHLKRFPKSNWATYLTAQMKAIETNLEMAVRPRPH